MAKHQHISNAMRNLLLAGDLAPGTMLPTTQQLAEQFDTSVFTVQTALRLLVEEGLLERKRRAGTFVKHNSAVLTCAGIYCGNGLLDEWEFAFFREMCQQLRRQLGEQNVRTILHLDMRPQEEHGEPLPALVEAVDERQIQALIVPLCDPVSTSWLTDLPISSTFTSYRVSTNRVSSDHEQLVRLAISRLHELGCVSIGLISNTRDEFFRFYDAFTSIIGELGLKTRDDWVMTPGEASNGLEAYGYESLRTLWQQEQRPQGLFVYPDTSARGVMTAILELGVRVPEKLKLVFHSNSGVNWICPLAVDRVESDVALWAAAMIEQIRRQKAAETVAPMSLPHQLRRHE